MQAQVEFHEELERQYESARTRLSNLKQEIQSYDKIINMLKEHIDENQLVQKTISTTNHNNSKDDERKKEVLIESYQKLIEKYEKYKSTKSDREEEYKRRLTEKTQLETQLNSMKFQMACIKKMQEPLIEQSSSLIQTPYYQQTRQQDVSFDYDVETINFLNECNWNLGGSCDRTLSETLLGCFPSGTFLVRSSKTKPNSFALSVVANSNVRHCLIDKNENGDYHFHPPGPNRQAYSSLCNLVMDYRHKSLIVHNPELDTNLIYPILSQLKKTSRGSNN